MAKLSQVLNYLSHNIFFFLYCFKCLGNTQSIKISCLLNHCCQCYYHSLYVLIMFYCLSHIRNVPNWLYDVSRSSQCYFKCEVLWHYWGAFRGRLLQPATLIYINDENKNYFPVATIFELIQKLRCFKKRDHRYYLVHNNFAQDNTIRTWD